MIQVRNQNLTIDILDEIEPYNFGRSRNRGTELTSCSPFRDENSPSFSINLETGQWIDFGSSDGHNAKGNLVSLLAHLRHESFEDTESYLIQKYGLDLSDIDSFDLKINLTDSEEALKTISLEDYKKYAFRHPYLESRGITERVQSAFKIGFDKKNQAVAMPWFDKKGNIVNIKFRSVKSKKFFYADGQQIRNHLYGIHFFFKMNLTRAFICESEIDALYLWSCGLPAIAIGGSNLTAAQKKLILQSPIKELVIATDNDEVGQKVKNYISSSLLGFVELYEFHLPEGKKDVNELGKSDVERLSNCVTNLGLSTTLEGFSVTLVS